MANTVAPKRDQIRNTSDPLELKKLNDDLNWIFSQLKGGVPGKALKNGAIDTDQLADGSVTESKVSSLKVTTTLTVGETSVEVYFKATGTQIGLYRSSDDKQLWGGKLLADGRVVTVTNALVDPDGNDNAYFQMNTDESSVSVDLVHGTHDGPAPENEEEWNLDDPPITAWERLLSLSADVVPCVSGDGSGGFEYSDEIFVTLQAILKGVFAIYGDQIFISALDGDTGESKCGFSFDAERDSRIRSWGHMCPMTNGTDSLGSAALNLRYKFLHCTEPVDVSSDARQKDYVGDVPEDFVLHLRPKLYRRKDDPKKKLRMGFYAQDIKEALDACGIENPNMYCDENPDSLSLRQEELFAPLVALVQKQDRQIKALQKALGIPEVT